MSAVLSPDGIYRYALWRDIPMSMLAPDNGTVLFVMLNPSTADATSDDATIRRCRGFAERWGHRRIAVVNLFALRATDPRELLDHPDPVGPENDQWIVQLASEAQTTVVAWGNVAPTLLERLGPRDKDVLKLIGDCWCLGRTDAGNPRHPVRLPGDQELEPYSWAA